MRRRNKYIILVTLVAVALGGILGRVAYSRGFTKKWREYISDEFAKRGVHLEFEKLTLDPVRGLVAREVTLFGDEKRTRMLAKIDHISLDMDYSGLLGKEMLLDSFDLKDAALRIELEPGNPKGERLTIQRFSARVFLAGDRIQIRRAEGLVNGIDVSLRGLFFNADSPAGIAGSGSGGEPETVGPAFQMEDLTHVVRWLDELEFDPKTPPQLEIDIHRGDLARPENLRGTLHFEGSDLQIGGYACEEMEAFLEMGRGMAVLKRFSVVDSSGRFDASAEYRFGDAAVKFHVESEADLPGFLLGALDWHRLAEVVFYEMPKVSADGEIFLWSAVEGLPPVRAVGRVTSGKVLIGGKIFDSAQTDFSIDFDRFYLRNTVVEHRTGGFSGEAMFDGEGFRYRANLTLDPRVFEPFCEKPSTRSLLQRFDFGRESAIYAEIAGAGADLDAVNWENVAEFELRNFKFDGVEFRKFGGLLNLASGVQTYRDLEISQDEGEASADMVRIDRVNEITEIRGFSGDIDMGEVMECFDADIADEIGRWKFRERPGVKIDGIADTGDGGRTDLEIGIEAPGGIDISVADRNLSFGKAEADLHLVGGNLEIAVGGELFGGSVKGVVRAEKNGGADTYLGNLEFDGIGFGELLRIYLPGVKSGGKLAGEFTFSDIGSDLRMFDVRGAAAMEGGDIFAIPCLRTLSGPIADVLGDPDPGFGTARRANFSFSIADGQFRTDDFEAETPVFRIRVGGTVDLLGDSVEFTAESDARGLKGARYFPRGGSLTYKGSGTVGATEWRR